MPLSRILSTLMLATALAAQGPPPARPGAPALEPGEGLAIAELGGRVLGFGESRKEAPMGSLAKLVWLRLEGGEWGSRAVMFKCTGSWEGHRCWLAKGHGRVDLAKATQDSCNLAFLAWVRLSGGVWKETYGESVARMRLEEGFGPFLGNRMPPGEGLPPLTPAWIGDGDLLRTTPEAFAAWLVDPMNEDVLDTARRLLMSFFNDEGWWFKTGTAPVPGDPAATSAWVAGCDGQRVVVLHLPRGRGKAEGLARIKAILGLPAK